LTDEAGIASAARVMSKRMKVHAAPPFCTDETISDHRRAGKQEREA
jgi:hypothetical protein